MRLLAVHDLAGEIVSLAASPSDSSVCYPGTQPGERVTEVDASSLPDLPDDLDVDQMQALLSDLAKTHRINQAGAVGRLERAS